MAATTSFEEYQGIIGRLVAHRRKRLKLSQGELSRAIGGVPTSDTLCRFENRQTEVHVTTVFKLAEVLGYDFVDDIYKELWKAAQRGHTHKRDELLDELQATQKLSDQKPAPLER